VVDQSRYGDVAGMRWTQPPDLLLRVSKHPTSKLGRHPRWSDGFFVLVVANETSAGELSSPQGQPMAHVDPLRFAFNRRMLDALDDESCNINTNPTH